MSIISSKRIYIGNEVEQIYQYYEQNSDVYSLVMDILSLSYRIHLGKLGQEFIEYSFDNLKNSIESKNYNEIPKCFAHSREYFKTKELYNQLSAYKVGSLHRTIKLIGMQHLKGTIADVGADNNLLGKNLIENVKDVEKVIGIDIEERNPFVIENVLDFKKMVDTTKIPLGENSVDVVILRFSLHHMEFATQKKIISECKRIIRPGGKIIVIEDTYSEKLVPLVNTEVHRLFQKLDSQQKQYALALLDASSCFIYEEKMPFTLTYHSIESWGDMLRESDFMPIQIDYWGIPFFSLFQAPLGILIYENHKK